MTDEHNPADTKVILAANIRHYRLSAGMTQKQLAVQLGYTSNTPISLIEKGERNVMADVGYKLSRTLNVSIDKLLTKEVKS